MSVVEGLKIQIHVCGTYVLSVWFTLLIGFGSVWIFSRISIPDEESEKGASSWLTSLPLAKYGFALNKQMFQDGICLRYNFALKLVARTCVCGKLYTVNHCMTCKKGGYVILRHNSLRDLFAEILEEVRSDVQIEPPLLPLTGEKLPHGSNITPGARLDVSARNLWSPLAKAFIDVRIFNPQAKTNWDRSIPQMYTSHENEKKTEYLPRVLQVEKATFTPAVFSTSGGIGKEADKLIRRMAERMSAKRGETYSSVVSFLRRRFRFDLLKTCIIADSAERLQEAIEHSSEDRDPGHGFEGNCYILLRITDVMYRCLKEDLIYFTKNQNYKN